MIERSHLEDIAKRQIEISKMKAELNDEFEKYRQELFQKAKEVLKWKDDNLGQEFLKYTTRGHIHKIKQNYIVLCLPDTDYESPNHYYNVSFDEIYSDDWKEEALKEYEAKKQRKLEEEQIAKENALIEQEAREKAEYERLRAKYENK